MVWWTIIGVTAITLLAVVFLMRKPSMETKQSLAEHAQPEELEQLLSFGALMLLRSKEPTRILPLNEDRESLRAGLIEFWDIADGKTARDTIQSLIVDGRRRRFEVDFSRLHSGESLGDLRSLDGEDYLRWEKAKALWEGEGLALAPDAATTMSAYDYERIAWLARCCLHLDYIDTQEAWRCIAWVAERSREEFSSWQDYAASYVLGRAATFDANDASTQDGIRAAKELLTGSDPWFDRPHLWQEYPLHTIKVSHELTRCAERRVQNASAQLFGFGALMARTHDESASTLAIPELVANSHERWLANAWSIADSSAATKCLEWLLDTGCRAEYEAEFAKMTQGSAAADLERFDAAAFVRFRLAKDLLIQAGLEKQCVLGCRSLLAYEMERAAYVARLALSVGYFGEAAALGYLRRIASLARSTFQTWEDYLASFLLAQAVFNSDSSYMERIMRCGLTLLKVRSPFAEYASLWQEYPLDELQVLHAVRTRPQLPEPSAV